MLKLATLIVLVSVVPAARAGAVVALDPPDGVIPGAPGATVGWGFTVTNGTNWISIDSVTIENETSPLGGIGGGFTSYMDLLGGFSSGVTAPSQMWTLPYSTGSPGTGIGQYAIDPGTALGSSDSGDFVIFYDEFSSDPNTCGGCFLDTLQMFDSNAQAPAFTINVTSAAVPEPAPVLLVIAGVVVVARRSRREKSR